MRLPRLQYALRIDPWIGIVQAGDIAERNQVVFGSIQPRAAVFLGGERPAQGEDNFAPGDASGRNLPELFDANAKKLRVAVFVQIELQSQLLGQRAARAFRQDRHLRLELVAWLEVRFLLAGLVDALVISAHAGDA